ncbi:RNA polymerase sigma-70 factor [Pseudoneobacillus sp. C159]
MKLEDFYDKYRPLLFSIAYRMLGTVTDAEDIVQDVFVLAGEKSWEQIDNQKAYLCKMVTNKCLDYLKSARNKRELYIGPWLPEPMLLKENDPYHEVLKNEDLSLAVLVVLEQLNPIERAVFILREVFQYDYQTIGEFIGKTDANCRKIFSRAKSKLPLTFQPEKKESNKKNEKIISDFVSAILAGNLQQLENILAQDVTLYSDGGGKVYAALKPIHTRNLVLRFITHLLAHYYQPHLPEPTVSLVNINGQTGIFANDQEQIKSIISFHVNNGQIQEIYVVRNPEKLTHIN